ncbi:ABC transporter substrate-binding protein [Yinghuangia sp. ASG 101]|uniref:ABC transporter substrate-binding protein n=1 Tax=Yinghuangia sp. ASG 101 TaxID=2896848 RepID=UPI001E58F1FE|nr:ABC transporter substrate-binding protein [Yinghuangia sp. ASG 101]UGQ12549.1 ABC transporter substrate-binding protein [Yinghuangia sp. ASG 101]
MSASHRFAAVVSASALALTVSACSGAGDTTAPGADAGPPRTGGTLTFALAIDPTCVDPQQYGLNASLNVGRQVVDSLTDQDPATGEIRPWLAESWEVNPQATEFTFHLRPGVTFSDGSPVDAAAVKANFDGVVALGAKAQVASTYLIGYEGSTVVDPTTVRVAFRAPSAQFLQATSTVSLGLLSTATLAKSPDERCQGALVGSGPFVLESYKQNQSVEITKRAGYNWGSSLWGKQGEAYLDKVVYQVIPESGVRAGALESGQVDAISDIQPQDEGRFENGAYTVLTRPNPGLVFSIQPNLARPGLDDESVRQAIQKVVDRPELTQTVLSPKYKAATSVLAAVTPGAVDLTSALAYDPAAAERVLDAAGWRPGSDGIRAKDGHKLSFDVVFAPAFNASQSVLELVQQQAKKSGIELRLRKVTASEAVTVVNGGDYDFLFGNLTRSDPDVLRVSFSTKGANRSHLPVGTPLDNALDQQAQLGDQTARFAQVAEAQRQLVDHGYVIPLFELAQVHGLSAKVHGVILDASSRVNFHDTWVKG